MVGIPTALQPYADQPRWVVWRLKKKGNKFTKVPYQALKPSMMASSDDPSTWADAATTIKTAASGNFDGIGICLLNSDLVTFDIDDCRDKDTGEIEPYAMGLIDRARTYCEITPSGTGLRIIGIGSGAKVHRKQKVPNSNGVTVETYRKCERYITVTGNFLEGTPDTLANIDPLADAVVVELDAVKGKGKKKANGAAHADDGDSELPASLTHRLYIPDQGAGEPHAGYDTRSELFFAFITEALRVRVSSEKIIAACLDEAHRSHAIYEHCIDNNGRDYVEVQIKKAQANSHTSDGKRIIKVERGKEYVAWRETQQALVTAGCQVFVRASYLVEPLWREEQGAEIDRPVLAMSLVKYNREQLTDQVARHAAVFMRRDGRSKDYVVIDPPRSVIETLLERKDWVFPTIAGIINTPTMRPDGSLLTEQGYDPVTQLWFKSSADAVLGPMPDAPTKSDAIDALKLLDDLLVEFPFVGALDKSVALAGIMTTVLRGAFPVAPLFFIAKSAAGTGASYFVRLVGFIATGQDATPLVASADPRELQKELSAKAFEGRPILNLNNLTFNLESALLCQMLTEGVVDIRPFGINTQTVSCDCRSTTVFANGNNIRLVGDLVRRAVTCRMVAKEERPELRIFKHDPINMVMKNRGAYLAAVFTIARAYIAAGSPDVSATALAGYEGWSKNVRHPLMWLGLDDPALSMEENRALDPERSELAELIDALVKCFGAAEFTAAEVFDQATKNIDGKLAHPELMAVFTAFSRDGRNINAKTIGNQLMKRRDQVSAGCSIKIKVSSSHRIPNKYWIDGAPAREEEPM